MKHSILLAALATTMLAGAASASAHSTHVAPAQGGGMTGGQLLGEAWTQGLSGRTAPFAGTCSTVARNVLVAHFVDGTATCRATPAARLFVFFGSFCSAAENPLLTTERAQLACAVSSDEAIHGLTITVDRGQAVDIHKRRFELFSPQRSVRLPADNEFGLPAGRTTFTAHAWGAVIDGLRPGRHTVAVQLVAPDFGGTFTFTTVLDIVRAL
ncbi:hypothetical protein OJ998_11180 [Solirubrobacter taibaiensis]|nr:hypothetical protein [Solirubrobacter taibaiensis]